MADENRGLRGRLVSHIVCRVDQRSILRENEVSTDVCDFEVGALLLHTVQRNLLLGDSPKYVEMR